MIRQIIHIDEEKCNGCGLCAAACHEGAIAVTDGKARLIREDYCDGMGDCLPECPMGAITFEQREAAAYDAEAVRAHQQKLGKAAPDSKPEEAGELVQNEPKLSNWPVQIRLAPVQAACFTDADLLVAADCTAYAYPAFQQDFIQNRTTLIGCPKLDDSSYWDKLAAIIRHNSIRSVTVVRMQVPCCAGLVHAVCTAIEKSGKAIPCRTVTISVTGTRIE